MKTTPDINKLLKARPRDSARGAPMGASNYDDRTQYERVYCQRVRFTDGDYGPDGTYWGTPADLYAIFTASLSLLWYVRAGSHWRAMKEYKKEHAGGWHKFPAPKRAPLRAAWLRERIETNAIESRYFSRENMKFSGDTMANYGARGPFHFLTNSGERCEVFELYRRKPVKHGLRTSAYFRADTFAQTWGEVV